MPKYALAVLAATAAFAQDIAITGATIVDGSGAPPRQSTVVLRGDRILSVGATPAGARIIDATGHTLLPGLFDLHTHLPYSGAGPLSGDWPKNLKVYLYCGVTSVADFGTYPETFEPMRRLLRDGVIPGPRIHLAARMTTPLGHGAEGGRGDFFSIEVQTPREARAAVKRLLAYSPDAIKVFTDGWRYNVEPDMTSMEMETLKAIVDAAHAQGVEVMTHTVTLERAKVAARAGVDVIAHGIGDAPVDRELIDLMKSKGTAYVTTLAVYEAKPAGLHTPLLAKLLEPRALDYVSKRTAASKPDPARQVRWKNLIGNVAALRAGGVTFGAGTDAGVTGTYHGWSTLRELELLVAGGLTPLEAITAATGNSARAIGVNADRGTIAAGKMGDLVLVEGAPHENIRDIRNVRRVFFGGKEIDREALAAAIAEPGPTPLPARKIPALIDDFETTDGRTRLGTLRVNSTDGGTDHTRMLWGTIARPGGGHALSVHARMSEKANPLARVVLPLTPGSVEPADVSAFRGVRFDVRGQGKYRLLATTDAVRDYGYPAAAFAASAEWTHVEIPFASLRRPGAAGAEALREMKSLMFEVTGAPGSFTWLELDNVRFY